jgi:hypothetical protein
MGRTTLRAALIASVLGLASCGGGGDDSSEPNHPLAAPRTSEATSPGVSARGAMRAHGGPRTVGPGARIAGAGRRELGTIHITEPAVLRWTNSGTSFKLYVGGLPGPYLSSTARTGLATLYPGVYRGISIRADGAWTLTLVKRP